MYIRGELVYERVRARVMRARHHQLCVYKEKKGSSGADNAVREAREGPTRKGEVGNILLGEGHPSSRGGDGVRKGPGVGRNNK